MAQRQTERCHLRGCSEQGSPCFCCARHKQMAEDRREWPRCDLKNVHSGNCFAGKIISTHLHNLSEGACTTTSIPAEPGDVKSNFELHFLDEGHPEHKPLLSQFVWNWKHKKQKTTKGVSVVSVIKVVMPKEVRERHEEYKRLVPNVRQRFHGTSRSNECRFHVGGEMCLRKDCALCSICKVGFKIGDNVGHSPVQHARMRDGRGIYFTSASRKAHQFTKQTAEVVPDLPGSPKVRFMLVADVVVGKSFETTKTNFQHLTSPPQGYDSMVGKVGPNLQYDELIVYNEAAALPTHIISCSFTEKGRQAAKAAPLRLTI